MEKKIKQKLYHLSDSVRFQFLFFSWIESSKWWALYGSCKPYSAGK